MNNNTELMDKAINSSNLSTRADINNQYGTNDFSAWTKNLISKLNFSSVLDICCGTGNQLVLYAGINDVKNIIGIDVSRDSLNTAKERLSPLSNDKNIILKNISIDEMFSDSDINRKFDLISCFYGLYYSNNVAELLNKMIDHLSAKGSIIIIGPYGNNNLSFFNLLQKYFTLPELVVKSSTTFMENEVLPVLSSKLNVEQINFLNPINYTTFESVFNYWKASTFYFKEHEKNVERDLKEHFKLHDTFVIEKHVKAYIARKYD